MKNKHEKSDQDLKLTWFERSKNLIKMYSLLICWKSLAFIMRNPSGSANKFSESVSKQLITVAQGDPVRALTIFNKYFTYRIGGLVWHSDHDAYYYLKFANIIKSMRPDLYEEALLTYIQCRSWYRDMLQSTVDVEAELVSILKDTTLHYEKNIEKILKKYVVTCFSILSLKIKMCTMS